MATATARPQSRAAGVDLDALTERVYQLLLDDLRLERLRRDGQR